MHKLLFLGLVILSSCSGAKPATYTLFCATPVGVASGEGSFTNGNATFTTDTGVTVYSPWANCVAVKK